MREKILVADDREGIRQFIAEALVAEGYETLTAVDGQQAFELLKSERFHLLITDLMMPRMDGMELLGRAREQDAELEVIILTAHGSIDNAVRAIKLGAFDYLTKPLEGPRQLREVVKRALDHRRLRSQSTGAASTHMLVVDPVMQKVKALIDKVAPTDATVLLLGESGTGKEVAAREIHQLSQRRESPFVAVNCAAMSTHLVESEMFGHEKGAFTGAGEQRLGRFDAADNGTLFLDEVGELPIDLQAKLLRVLQDGRFERVGGTQTREVNVRIIAATNRDLQKRIAEGAFREDLYHRLSVFPIELPPLRDRPLDILPLSSHLLESIARRLARSPLTLSEEARQKLLTHSWPGNVRELGNVLERASILAGGETIAGDHLNLIVAPDRENSVDTGSLSLRDMERETIKKALLKTDGHRKKAADLLGIGLRTLYKKIKEFDLE